MAPSISPADWSTLPAEILTSILERLPEDDRVRAGAVCVGWRSAARQLMLLQLQYPTQSPSTLWVLATSRAYPPASSPATRDFFTFPAGKQYQIRIPELRWGRCIGSSLGWLVVVDNGGELRLVNPLAGAGLSLPRFKPYHEAYDGKGGEEPAGGGFDDLDDHYSMAASFVTHAVDWYFAKAVLSLGQSLTVVVVIYSRAWKLAALITKDVDDDGCRGGSWTELQTPFDGFTDVAFHGGRVFAVTYRGTAVACDLSDPSCPVATCVVSQEIPRKGKLWEKNLQYLAGSARSGRLFLVWRVSGSEGTRGVDVFELDASEQRWRKVESLGKVSLFAGNVFSGLCVEKGSSAPEVEGNCIYFAGDGGRHDVEVVHLEDWTLETRHLGGGGAANRTSRPVWFTPQLCSKLEPK